MTIIQYLLQVKLGEEMPSWKMTFNVASDNMARVFAKQTLKRDWERWKGVKFELWREPEQTLITTLQVGNEVEVTTWD